MSITDAVIKTRADKLAVEQGCYWNEEEGEKVIRFAETYFHCPFVKGKLKLLAWQKNIIKQLYCWRLPTGQRRFSKALLLCAKKQGKTLLTSIICLYELMCSSSPTPITISASTTWRNAEQVYSNIKHTIDRNPGMRQSKKGEKVCKLLPSKKQITNLKNGGKYMALSSDGPNAEGENILLAVIDEGAWHQGDKLYRSLEYSIADRPDGLIFVISTPGNDQSHWFYDFYCKGKNILNGTDTDITFFADIYECPIDADINDPANWYLANPSLGQAGFTVESFRRDLESAKSNTADLLNFRKRRLAQWCQSNLAWLDLTKWDRCKQLVPEERLQQSPCWIGCDLSQTTDLSAVCLVFYLGDKRYFVKSYAFACEEGVKKREATNLPKYQQFAADGSLTITSGDVADYPKIKRFILDLRERYKVKEVIFDKWNAIDMATELMSEGLTVYKFAQSYASYTHPCKQFEAAIAEGRIHHDGNSLLRWQIQNVSLSVDPSGNCLPCRKKSTDKIDCVVASVMAFSRALESSAEVKPVKSVYAERGLLVL